ncbi:gamma-glutamyltransferase [Acidovorax sp. Leaf76]|uniref:gamma-glutamyltransferase n=1 Tax=unclassified Acidovorax TaxID=2684926 RepID=UPI0006FD95F8|nr:MULTISPECIES: gamma-glutamyltransferase [unclassified Acidovorax]KQO26567.1 gamma-glutamyltransferase [Acidovorax sp. Leaf76]KQO40342.1 gamma-glutamyltransferase [Acidovorax sp. Leaf84]KQS42480.1 gamma-glutamyltransferase [Acidovorax sp. Leaf191]
MTASDFSRKPALWALSLAALAVLSACGGSDGPSTPVATPEPVEQYVPPEPPSGYTPKTISYANKDMVSTANPLATKAGVDILAKGGSALDAAIAVQMVLNLVEPQSSGIGGGAFMLHFDKGANKLLAYDGRETAPKNATPNLFIGADGKPLAFLAAVDGGLSVGTPGVLRMLEAAHKVHGKLPWKDLFEPAIALSDNGFAISPRMSVSIAGSAARIKAQGEPGASYFLNADGTAKAAGTLLKNPELAATLRAIAAGGADAFYKGDIAKDIVAKVASHPTNPGKLSLDDLNSYTHKVREPVCGVYRTQYRVCGMPAPSSGGIAVLQTLGLLQGFDLAAMKPNTLDSVHVVSEAYRLAYADRAVYVADPDFVNVPQAGLINADYLKDRAKLISLTKSIGTPTAGTPPGVSGAKGLDNSAALPSTTHLSIIDNAGNAVSMTTTIENGFGSLQMVRGFLLNNQLTDFSFTATDAAGLPIANSVQPGKRPRSSMAPTIVFNATTGDLEGAIGSPGGSAIIQYTAKAILGMTDWGLNVQQAINLPNFGAQTNATTSIEKGSVIDTVAIRDGLKARGHTVAQTDTFTSGLHGAVYNGVRGNGTPGLFARNPGAGTFAGGADPRREGTAQGNN